MNTTTFADFALPEALAENLSRMNFTKPTPIQAKSIPFALDGRDIMGSAQTGTGKTGAFCVPMIAALIENSQAHAMVMTPTRELAMQVMDVARQMIPKGHNIRTALLIGGEPMGKQFKQLNDRPRLIIGTPGRMNDHLRRRSDLFDMTNFVVLDEADRMLDMGFSVQIDTILAAAAPERQTLMFSATFPAKIEKFARTYLQNPQRVEIEAQKITAENISHEMTNVAQDQKYDVLRGELEARMGSIIVFVKTKHGADKLARRLSGDGHDARALHGGLNQRQRERATKAYRKMDFRVLIATDVAARGLDIPHVEHVINYDMPMVAEDYIHRIGRTARAGAKGNALAMVSPSDKGLWLDVERIMYPDRAPAKKERRGGNDNKQSRDGEGRKPFRKGKFSKVGFNKKREGGRGRNEERGEEKGYAGRSGFNDRPRKKGADGAKAKFRKPREEGASFEGERFYGDDVRPAQDGRPQRKKPMGQKPFGKKPAGKKVVGKKHRDDTNRGSDQPRSFKKKAGKPNSKVAQGGRRGAARYSKNGPAKGNGGNTFRKRKVA